MPTAYCLLPTWGLHGRTNVRRILSGGRVVDPSQKIDREADVLIEDERIVAIVDPGAAGNGAGGMRAGASDGS